MSVAESAGRVPPEALIDLARRLSDDAELPGLDMVIYGVAAAGGPSDEAATGPSPHPAGDASLFNDAAAKPGQARNQV